MFFERGAGYGATFKKHFFYQIKPGKRAPSDL